MFDRRKAPPPAAPLGPTGSAVFLDETVVKWFLGLLLMHVLFQAAFMRMPSKVQAKPGVAAHQLTTLAPFVYATACGLHAFLYEEPWQGMTDASYAERIYLRSESAWVLVRFMIGFQMYDLLATALEPSLRKAEHLGHHSATLITAFCSATIPGPFFLHYVPFFFGMIEGSSVFLVFVDLYRQIPSLAKGPVGALCNEVCRNCFAVSFFLLRCFAFPYVMVAKFWPDLCTAYAKGDVRMAWPVYGWMWFSTIFLTWLQLFWGYKVRAEACPPLSPAWRGWADRRGACARTAGSALQAWRARRSHVLVWDAHAHAVRTRPSLSCHRSSASS